MAKVGAEDSVGFPQQALDLIPEPRERLRSTFEGERLDLVSEKVQPFRDCRAPGLQLGAHLLRPDRHASLASTACGSPSSTPAPQALPSGAAAQAVPFLGLALRPSFSSIASTTKSMSAMSCVTQCSFRRRWSSFGMRVANCVHTSSVFAIMPPCSSIRVDDR